MRMTTCRLFIFRLFNKTFGRCEKISHLFKKALIFFIIKSKKEDKYVASSRFFSREDLK